MADIGHDRSVLEIVPRAKVIFESELIYGGNNVLESKEGTKITTIDEEEMSAAKRNDAPQTNVSEAKDGYNNKSVGCKLKNKTELETKRSLPGRLNSSEETDDIPPVIENVVRKPAVMAAVEAAACSEIANGVRSPMQETALITPVMSNADRARTVKTIAGVRPNGGRGRRNIDIKIGNQSHNTTWSSVQIAGDTPTSKMYARKINHKSVLFRTKPQSPGECGGTSQTSEVPNEPMHNLQVGASDQILASLKHVSTSTIAHSIVRAQTYDFTQHAKTETHVKYTDNAPLDVIPPIHPLVTLTTNSTPLKQLDGVAPPIAPPTLDKVPYSVDPSFSSIDWCPSKPGLQTENTLLIDDGFGRDGNRPRIMGQLSQSGISLISKGRHFAGDGTFAIAPHVFTQVYTLQVFVGAKFRAVPVAVFYLPNKTKRTYMRMFALLKQLVFDVTGIELIMESLIIDFEAAVDIAATMIWPDIKIFYCLSHLSKSVYERVKSENLEDEYINDVDFQKSAHYLVSLAFLPPEDVVNVFQQIQWHPLIVGIVSGWFEPYYIGSVIMGVRQPPMFAISKWNVHSRVLAGQPRSNNALEGLNNKLMIVVGRSHPTFFASLGAVAVFLRQVHVDEMHVKQQTYKRGARNVGVQNDALIARIVKNYVAGDAYDEAVEYLTIINTIVNMDGSVDKAVQKSKQRALAAAAKAVFFKHLRIF